jgi:hypothetical protein
MDARPLQPHPRRDDLPPDASLPDQAPPPATRHPAANLELVGRCGTLALVGVFGGLMLLDLQSWLVGAGLGGESLLIGGAMGVTVLPVGALAWAAGWRLRRQRGEPPALGPGLAWRVNVAAALTGIMLALILGFPSR